MKQLQKFPLKERYDFTCPVCSKEQFLSPSMMMANFGLNTGAGRCLKCETYLHLELTDDEEWATAMPFDQWNLARKAETV